VGLTTALVALRNGDVVSNVLNGTVAAGGKTVPGGSVIRIVLQFTSSGPVVMSNQVIATGFGTHTDPNALVTTGGASDARTARERRPGRRRSGSHLGTEQRLAAHRDRQAVGGDGQVIV
jgi:hypothetical protein